MKKIFTELAWEYALTMHIPRPITTFFPQNYYAVVAPPPLFAAACPSVFAALATSEETLLGDEPGSTITFVVGTVGPALLGLGCGGGPEARKEMNLFNTSNQKGEPSEMANVVASRPTIFKTQPQTLPGRTAADQPICG